MSIFDFFKSKLKRELKKNFTRKAYRRTAKFSVAVIPVKVKNLRSWTRPEYVGKGTDISPKGVQVESYAPFQVGDLVRLQFALHEGSKTIEVAAKVRNLRPGADGKNISGLEFSSPSREVSKYLETILLLYK